MDNKPDPFPEVTDLRTCIILPPNTPITIRCSSQVELRPHKLSERSKAVSTFMAAESPITIRSGVRMHLLPMDNLTPAFATGWNKLPDEIKCEILRYSLQEPDIVNMSQTPNRDGWPQSQLCRHLKMSPDIARLAQDIFYEVNTFELERAPGSQLGRRFWYPKTNSRIKRVVVILRMFDFRWLYLERLANGTYGFADLQHVRIELKWPGNTISPSQRFAAHVMQHNIRFSCKGLAVVAPRDDFAAVVVETIKTRVINSIHFGGNS